MKASVWKVYAPVIVLSSLVVVAASTPGGDVLFGLLAFLGGMACLVWVLACAVTHLIELAHNRITRSRALRRVLFAPMLGVLIYLACLANIPLYARFIASLPFLNAAADSAVAGKALSASWIGLYPVKGCQNVGGTVFIDLKYGGHPFDDYFFVRSPAGAPALLPAGVISPNPPGRVRHVLGSWYIMEYRD